MLWYEGTDVSTAHYLTTDQQGSVTAATDASGNMQAVYTYDEYGLPLQPSGTLASRFRYTGQVWLPEVGLYNYKARLYDPKIGRFLQTDPIGYGDRLNWYAYVGNDPVNLVDPFGLTCSWETLLTQHSTPLEGGINSVVWNTSQTITHGCDDGGHGYGGNPDPQGQSFAHAGSPAGAGPGTAPGSKPMPTCPGGSRGVVSVTAGFTGFAGVFGVSGSGGIEVAIPDTLTSKGLAGVQVGFTGSLKGLFGLGLFGGAGGPGFGVSTSMKPIEPGVSKTNASINVGAGFDGVGGEFSQSLGDISHMLSYDDAMENGFGGMSGSFGKIERAQGVYAAFGAEKSLSAVSPELFCRHE